jgi:hypothetical protein
MRKHWPPPKRTLGLGLMTLGVGARALLSRVATGAAPRAWRVAWSERREWLPGYPPPDAGS